MLDDNRMAIQAEDSHAGRSNGRGRSARPDRGADYRAGHVPRRKREPRRTSDATDRALDALFIAARETFIVIEEARQRASAACSSIEPPR